MGFSRLFFFDVSITSSAEARVFVVPVGAVVGSVAQVLDGDASAIAWALERFVRVARFAWKEEQTLSMRLESDNEIFSTHHPSSTCSRKNTAG